MHSGSAENSCVLTMPKVSFYFNFGWRLFLESGSHHVGELVLDLVDSCLGCGLGRGLLDLLAHGAKGLGGGRTGHCGCLVQTPPVGRRSRV